MSIILKQTPREAKAAGDPFYFTGKPCPKGHIAKRYTSGPCIECNREYSTNHKPEAVARAKRHLKANPDSAKARSLRWRAKNKHKVNAIEAKRRAAKLNATPPWLTDKDLLAIARLFAEATRLSKETGEKYHVDHIVPLQGETVRGLHVPCNLRVISAFDNLSKHNSLIGALV